MIVSLIVAVAENGVIGKDNALPWRLSSDLKRFKKITMSKPIIMGRKTHESIGKPLPGRTNIVVTRNPNYDAEGCLVVDSFEAAVIAAQATGADEAFVIGGAALYEAALPLASRIYLTEVHCACDGDAWFPPWDRGEWHESHREEVSSDEVNQYATTFQILQRALGIIA
jgi:dihydrofolate reductase